MNFTIPARSMKREVLLMLMDSVPTRLRYDARLPECWPILRDLVCGKIMSTLAAAVSVGKNRQGRSAFTTTVVRTGLIIQRVT